MMENHGYYQVLGNPNEPYLNSLITNKKISLEGCSHDQLADEEKPHQLQSDGRYIRSSKSGQPDALDSQLRFLNPEDSPLKTKGSAALSH